MAMSQLRGSEKYINFTGLGAEEVSIRIVLECFSIVTFSIWPLSMTNLGCEKLDLLKYNSD